jgi:hypothetical protein
MISVSEYVVVAVVAVVGVASAFPPCEITFRVSGIQESAEKKVGEERTLAKSKSENSVNEVMNRNIPTGFKRIPKNAELGVFFIVKNRHGIRLKPMKDM